MMLTRKLPRTRSLITAILWLLIFLIGTITSVSNWISAIHNGATIAAVSIVSYFIGSLATVFSIVVLFRGKKDKLAGVLLILGAAIGYGFASIVSGVAGMFSAIRLIATMGDVGSALMGNYVFNILSALAAGVFCVLAAIECFKPGAFSTSKAKSLFIILPIVHAVLSVCGSISIQMMSVGLGANLMIGVIVSTLVSELFAAAPMLLMGIAFAKPVYEQDPSAAQYAAYTYDQQCVENPYEAQYAEDPNVQQPVDPNYYG